MLVGPNDGPPLLPLVAAVLRPVGVMPELERRAGVWGSVKFSPSDCDVAPVPNGMPAWKILAALYMFALSVSVNIVADVHFYACQNFPSEMILKSTTDEGWKLSSSGSLPPALSPCHTSLKIKLY
jgi:hypothetical protein